MNRLLNRRGAIAAGILLIYCPYVWGQEPPRVDESGSEPLTSDPWEPRVDDSGLEPLMNFEWEGGALYIYLERIQDAAGAANILVLPSARWLDANFQGVRLDSVSIRTALKLIEGVYEQKDGPPVDVHVEEIGSTENGARSVLRVSAAPVKPTPTEVRVWNVLDMVTTTRKPADVLTAIETATDLLADKDNAPVIRYHEPTGVLIARGLPEQLELIESLVGPFIAENVLTEVFGAAAGSSDSPPGSAQALEKILAEIKELKTRVSELESHVKRSGKD